MILTLSKDWDIGLLFLTMEQKVLSPWLWNCRVDFQEPLEFISSDGAWRGRVFGLNTDL